MHTVPSTNDVCKQVELKPQLPRRQSDMCYYNETGGEGRGRLVDFVSGDNLSILSRSMESLFI